MEPPPPGSRRRRVEVRLRRRYLVADPRVGRPPWPDLCSTGGAGRSSGHRDWGRRRKGAATAGEGAAV
jgi:hypothetical protein